MLSNNLATVILIIREKKKKPKIDKSLLFHCLISPATELGFSGKPFPKVIIAALTGRFYISFFLFLIFVLRYFLVYFLFYLFLFFSCLNLNLVLDESPWNCWTCSLELCSGFWRDWISLELKGAEIRDKSNLTVLEWEIWFSNEEQVKFNV